MLSPWPRSPIISTREFNLRKLVASSASANSTSRTDSESALITSDITCRKISILRAKSIIVRSINSTAVGPKETIDLVAVIASWKLWKWHTPRMVLLGSGERANSTFLKKAKVPSDPTRICAKFSGVVTLGTKESMLYPPTLRINFGNLKSISSASLSPISSNLFLNVSSTTALSNSCRSGPRTPNIKFRPSASRASIDKTLSRIVPYRIDLAPQELFPTIPPIVAWLDVDMSTGNQSP